MRIRSILVTMDSYDGWVQGTDGNFYGTTALGGTNGMGAIFKLSMRLGPFAKSLPVFGKVGAKVVIQGTNDRRDQRHL